MSPNKIKFPLPPHSPMAPKPHPTSLYIVFRNIRPRSLYGTNGRIGQEHRCRWPALPFTGCCLTTLMTSRITITLSRRCGLTRFSVTNCEAFPPRYRTLCGRPPEQPRWTNQDTHHRRGGLQLLHRSKCKRLLAFKHHVWSFLLFKIIIKIKKNCI